MKTSQKEAVFQAVTKVLREHGIAVREGQNVAKVMTREFRAVVNAILFQGFKSGAIELETPEILNNDSDLKTYVSGLQSNWLRKDKRLNGNTVYKPANPGSRTGSADAQLSAMRKLLAQTTDPRARAEIQSFIEARVKQLQAAKKPAIDVKHLPQALHKYAIA